MKNKPETDLCQQRSRYMTTSEWEVKQVYPGVWAIGKDTTPFNTIYNSAKDFSSIPGFDRAVKSVKSDYKQEHWQDAGYLLYKNPQTAGADKWHNHNNPFLVCIKSNQKDCGTVIGLGYNNRICAQCVHKKSIDLIDKDFSSIIQLETDFIYLIDKYVFHRSPITNAERWMYRCFLFPSRFWRIPNNEE